MIKNIFLSAWRKLTKNKTTTIVNIIGLTLGIAVTMVIYTMVQFALGYDKFQKNYDGIYRVVHQGESNGQVTFGYSVPGPYYEALKSDMEGLYQEAVMISESYQNRLSLEDEGRNKVFNEETGVYFVTDNYFDVFTHPILSGEARLMEPNTGLISKSWAEKFFAGGDAVGKTVNMNDRNVLITGLVDDPKPNSDFPFNLIVSYETIRKEKEDGGWGSVYSGDQIYLLLDKPTENQAAIEERFTAFVTKHYDEETARTYKPFLQPLATIHSDERFEGYSYNTTPKAMIYAFVAIAIFMIITACINFINLTTALALKRTKEVGVRKIMGGSKAHIASIFWGETALITIISVFLSLIVADAFIEFLNTNFDQQLGLLQMGLGKFSLFLLSLTAIIVLVAATYPSWVLTRISPVLSIQNFYTNKASGSFKVRKGLVFVQFLIAQFFIVATLVLLKQMNYLQNMDMGFVREGILNVSPTSPYIEKLDVLKEEIKQLEGVENVTLTYTNPASGNVSATGFNLAGKDDEQFVTQIKLADNDFLNTYGIKLLAGENINVSDTITQVLVNEKLTKQLGFEEPRDIVGQSIRIWSREVPVVGVVEDFNTTSARNEIAPTTIFSNKGHYRMLSIRVSSQNLTATTNKIIDVVKAHVPQEEFRHQYLEEEINQFYRGEQNMAKMISIFAAIVVFIGCLGLYGLVTFMVNVKVKEVGIRKVLGASVQQIVMLFTKEYGVIILMAFVVAAPLAGFLMGKWMDNYANKTTIGPEVYLAALVSIGVLAAITVGWKSVRAAMANPVDSLKSE
ncbi:ABC transporter permease [Cytophagales bacterium LB-30]|uniref:ABC transporter permease n=1 Tax=Shiella aurantiaca TaxID=3058365 RepID=A0ABT8F3P0_9BACT|nr:ABC transporter permease [Shiella aurantiaca]MDN4165076.1 ABC transporter permease [Shiella aurantiaca]